MATSTFQTHILKVYNHTPCPECVFDFKTQLSLLKALQDNFHGPNALQMMFLIYSNGRLKNRGGGRWAKAKKFFQHVGLKEHRMTNIIDGTHFHGSGIHTSKPGSRTSLAMCVPGLAGAFF